MRGFFATRVLPFPLTRWVLEKNPLTRDPYIALFWNILNTEKIYRFKLLTEIIYDLPSFIKEGTHISSLNEEILYVLVQFLAVATPNLTIPNLY